MDSAPAGSAPVTVRVSGLSDVGRIRSINQDRLLAADLTLRRELGGLSEPVQEFGVGDTVEAEVGPKGFLILVADGMGGAQSGDVASRMAATGVYEEIVTNWVAEADDDPGRFAKRLLESVREANRRIYEASQQHAEYHGMGSTVTAGAVLDDVFYLGQVGDSRAYLVRGGAAIQLSRDQSMVEEMVRAGEMTEEDAARSQYKNVLVQAMGTVPEVEVDLSFQQLRLGDRVVLCSDGLTNLVSDAEIAHAVQTSSDVSIACSELVAVANARGGADNVTVVIAEFGGPGLVPPSDGEAVGYAAFGSAADPVGPAGDGEPPRSPVRPLEAPRP